MFPGRIDVYVQCPTCKNNMQVIINEARNIEYIAKWQCTCYQNIAFFVGTKLIGVQTHCMN